MPEKKKKPAWLTKLEEVREKSDDPVVDGIVGVGQFTVTENEAAHKRIDEALDQGDKNARAVSKVGDDLRTEMEAGFGVMSERLDALSKRSLITSHTGGSGIHGVDRLYAVIPDDRKADLYTAESLVNARRGRTERPGERKREEIMGGNPALHVVANLWFVNAMKLMCPRRFGGHQAQLHTELERYDKALADAFGGESKAAYTGLTDATGGYLIPTMVAAEILRIVQDSGVVVSRARHMPMGSRTMKIPNEATGVTIQWDNEDDTISTGEGTFGENTLTAERITGGAAASIESIEDSVVGLIPYIQNVIAEKIGKELDTQALEGTGSPHTGLGSDAAVNEVLADATNGAYVTVADVINMAYATDESSIEENAMWFMHRKMLGSLVGLRADAVTAADGAGALLFQPSMAAGVPATLMGFPVVTTSAISHAVTRGTTSNTTSMYFGDPRRIIFGDRQQLRFDVTETGPGWAKYRVDLRVVGRFGLTVGTPAAFSRGVGFAQLGAALS